MIAGYAPALRVLDIIERGWPGNGEESDATELEWLRSVWLGLPLPEIQRPLAFSAWRTANAVMGVMMACGALRLREYEPLIYSLDVAQASLPEPTSRFQTLRRQVNGG